MNFETAEVTYEKPHRLSGILLHPTSCPSPYGIGDLGQDAYDFVDFLEKSGQHLWQILPLTPTGFGDSPYQSFSAFAGQPLLISPAHLKELGLLEEAELSDLSLIHILSRLSSSLSDSQSHDQSAQTVRCCNLENN